jgi:hypothetical protein
MTRLPPKIGYFLRGTQQFFRFRHQLIFCWTLVLILVYQDKATLKGLSRLGPRHLCEWHLRRFLCAHYWCWRMVLSWMVQAVLSVLPPPEDGIVLVVGDGTYKGKTGKKNPLAKKGRQQSQGPYLFGLQILFLMVAWGPFRVPVDLEIVRRKGQADHHSPNALFRQMLDRFQPPAWAKQVIVIADAEFPSKETLKRIKKRGYYFVMSLARTWKFEDGRALKDLVRHLPHGHLDKVWLPAADQRRRVYWVYRKDVRLRHVGDVTLVLSKTRRNDGPHKTKILVTNLPQASSRLVIALYARRWSVELLIKELKGVTGLGQAQVTKDPGRVERAVSLSVMAYLLLIRMQHQQIPKIGAWSAFTLKRSFAWEVCQQQLEHSFNLKLRRLRSTKLAA